jgi:3-deoxy-D-manno-octulosonic-acid transferase
VHAPSAGEWRQAEAVIQSLRGFRPGLQFAFTYTSPSAERVAADLGPEVHGLLPWDRPRDIADLLDQLRPQVLIITKLDLWPELALQARARDIPIVIIAATVRQNSTRLHGPARLILRSAYESVDLGLAVGPEDAVRLAALGVDSARISVVGDPRYDGVLERIAGLPDHPSPELMVAGSTWPEDDRVLLQGFVQVRDRHPKARLLIIPHRPSERGIERIGRLARKLRLPSPQVTEISAITQVGREEPPPLEVGNGIGPLAMLYGQGALAYVGGGFGRRGLHSVLEPAAWGRPVIVGPNWRESRDAEVLKGASALTALGWQKPGEELAWHWSWLLENRNQWATLGARAREVVRNGSGAAKYTAGFVLEVLQKTEGRK